MKHYLFFDTETTGFPKNIKAPLHDLDNWCRVIQIAWVLTNEKFETLTEKKFYIEAKDFDIPSVATGIHGIDKELTLTQGVKIDYALDEFSEAFSYSNLLLVAHNLNFDFKVVSAELYRAKKRVSLRLFLKLDNYCTMLNTMNLCKLPSKIPNKYKYPKLAEAYQILFNKNLENAHDALVDVHACKEVFEFLVKQNRDYVREI